MMVHYLFGYTSVHMGQHWSPSPPLPPLPPSPSLPPSLPAPDGPATSSSLSTTLSPACIVVSVLSVRRSPKEVNVCAIDGITRRAFLAVVVGPLHRGNVAICLLVKSSDPRCVFSAADSRPTPSASLRVTGGSEYRPSSFLLCGGAAGPPAAVVSGTWISPPPWEGVTRGPAGDGGSTAGGWGEMGRGGEGGLWRGDPGRLEGSGKGGTSPAGREYCCSLGLGV